MLPALRRLISLRRIGPAGNTEQHRPDKLQRRAFSGFIAPIQDGNPLLQPDLPLLQAAKAADLQLLNPHSSAPAPAGQAKLVQLDPVHVIQNVQELYCLLPLHAIHSAM
ncbi:hypothetical protein D3C86_1994030 [compost metagenome]